MMFRKLFFYFPAALILSAALSVVLYGAVVPDRDYTENDGLLNSKVYSVAQGGDGRMWFALRGGVTVYDGAEWIQIRDSHKNFRNSVSHIEAEGKSVWGIKTFVRKNDGVMLLINGKWENVDNTGDALDPESVFRVSVTSANSDSVIMGSNLHGLLLYSKTGGLRPFYKGRGLNTNVINCITRSGNTYYAGSDRGVIRITDKPDNFRELNNLLPDTDIRGLKWQDYSVYRNIREKKRVLWVAGKNWIGYYDGNIFNYKKINIPMKGFSSLMMQPDYAGGIYIVGLYRNKISSDLFYFDSEKNSLNIKRNYGFRHQSINDMFMDRELNLWVATSRGVSRIVNRKFLTINRDDGLLEDEVSAFCRTKDGRVKVYGHNLGYTVEKDGEFKRYYFCDDTSKISHTSRVMDIREDKRGHLFLACMDFGLIELDRDLKSRRFPCSDISSAWVLALLMHEEYGILAGTGNGLYRYNKGQFEKVSITENLNIKYICKGRGRDLYFATSGNGIAFLSSERITFFKNSESIDCNSVYNILVRPDSRIIAGTKAGLCTVRQGGLEKFKYAGTKIPAPVYSLREDLNGDLLVGSYSGLYRIKNVSDSPYAEFVGLRGQECNRNALTVFEDKSVGVGTNNGFSRYLKRFDFLEEELNRPLFRFRYLSVKNRRFNLDKDLSFKHSDNYMQINYMSPTFINETKTRYFIKLEKGGSGDWEQINRVQVNRIDLMDMAPGRYRIFMKSINALGIESKIAVTPYITIEKPYWKQLKFIVPAGIIFILFFYFLIAGVLKKKYIQKLEEDVSRRTRELKIKRNQLKILNSELAESVKTKDLFFSIISHDLRNPFTALIAGTSHLIKSYNGLSKEEVLKVLREVNSAAETTYVLLNNLLDWSRAQQNMIKFEPEKVSVQEVIQNNIRIAEPSAREKDIFISDNSDKEALVEADLYMLEFIIRNLISNAVKFTPAQGRVDINTEEKGGFWEISVKDNGIGMEDEVLGCFSNKNEYLTKRGTSGERGAGMGLCLSSDFIEKHKSEFTVISQKGRGTCVSFLLKKLN